MSVGRKVGSVRSIQRPPVRDSLPLLREMYAVGKIDLLELEQRIEKVLAA